MALVHHSAICVRDVEESLRFWRDGLGFDVLLDQRFTGDWPTLLGTPTTSLRAVFLGRPTAPEAGVVELVDLGGADAPHGRDEPPPAGFLLLSVFTDVDAALGRLAGLGLGGEPRSVYVSGVRMCTVVDPDGVVVELVDNRASANLDRLVEQ